MTLSVKSQPSNTTAEAQVDTLLEQMTLAEKIGQMTQVEKNSISASDVTRYFIGSVLSGGGGNPTPNTAQAWARMVRDFLEAALETRLRIPLIYGVDAVHGHSNVHGSVIFPHNIGLGATRDADLIQRIAEVTSKELLATNVHWNFAPAVSIPQDIRWGRIYEGYSESTDIVTPLAVGYVKGLLNSGVLPSVKHFVADGGTAWGSSLRYDWLHGNWQLPGEGYSIDQGNAEIDEATLRAVHLPPYKAAMEAGALNIMVSFSSWQGVKMHAQKYLITDVLKNEWGFEGFVVSDWMAVSQIDPSFYTCVVSAINAGLDMIMVPFDYKQFIATLTEAVEKGDVPLSRIDNAVRRILKVKQTVGLFEQPFGDESLLSEFGSDEHRAVAREAVRKSLVLLKNDNNLLPLSKFQPRFLVAGDAANNIGIQCGGWTIDWQGGRGAITAGESILTGIQQIVGEDTAVEYSAEGQFMADPTDIGIVVIGEPPYAEGMGDRFDLTLPAEDVELINKMRKTCTKLVVIMLSGRPRIITEQLDQADAFVLAWLPGTEAEGISDVLFGDFPFTGKLSHTYPRTQDDIPLQALKQHPNGALFPLGYGLTTDK
ncbi:MAG: glycoside hydrolase family 3 protein [Anaerolineae bacterium]|nr:glycoside hydrolase family 3 protein [Anaerolineae bacterium]